MTNDISEVARAVEIGFSRTPRRLFSWLFYDAAGDRFFQSIMEMPEYYLTRCEHEILEENKDDLLRLFKNNTDLFNLIELGAGNGLKTEILLKHLSKNNARFIYTPIDVSETGLKTLTARLLKSIPNLDIQPINNRYDEALMKLKGDESKVFLFLGASIGNFTPEEAVHFVRQISAAMKDRDQFLIGFDLKKDPRVIQAAYDDPHGNTRDFNMNLLVRLNRELGAGFKLDNFSHYACYSPETGQNRSYLVSRTEQDIFFKISGRSVHFRQWEVIHTEISQKYDREMIEKLASDAGLDIVEYFYDSKNYFCDVLLRKTTT